MTRATLATLALCTLLLLTIADAAPAQIPAKLNYQVMLTDDADQPLADQTVAMVFTFYDAESGGTALWTETQNPTTNSIGVVSVILGSVTPVEFDFDAPMWLEVEVNGETLSPRRELTAAPYAGYAAGSSDSERLGNIDASEYALLTDLVGTGDGHSLDADDGNPTDALYVDANGDVGIGTTAPQAELHVQQEIQVGSTATLGRLEVHGGSAANGAIRLEGEGTDGGGIYIDNGTGATFVRIGSSGDGGYLSVGSDVSGAGGISVVGDGYGSGGGLIAMYGPSRYLELYMGAADGDDTVLLPDEAINAYEILDEPGVASIQASNSLDLTPGAITSVAARTIWVPNDGFVFAMGTAQVEIYNYDSAPDCIWFGISESQNAWSGGAQEQRIQLSAGSLTVGWYYFHAAVQGVFEVNTGEHTFYMNAQETSGECNVLARQLTLMYFPTAYGGVDTTD